jgi:P-type Cu+ transporter
MERDPVCGMNVDPEKAKGKAEYGRKSYYFCSAGCAKRFEQAPQQFLSAPVPDAASHGIQIAAAAKPGMASLPILDSPPRVQDPVCGMMVDP